jgi:2-iminoacetate synthase
MDLAKPGTIKGKCSVNALITLKEYLDDFGSSAVKQAGYRLIDQVKPTLPAETVGQPAHFLRILTRASGMNSSE